MSRTLRLLNTIVAAVAIVGATVAASGGAGQAPPSAPAAGPILVMETSKGIIEFETFPAEAPKTVERVVSLVKRNFYNGLRFHRVVPKFVVQVGDPLTRDMTKRARWGSGGSGKPIGVAEFSKKRTHTIGAVAMAYAGTDATKADSQFYITLSPQPRLDGKYTVFGHVITGQDVVGKIVEDDMIKKMYVKGSAPAPKATK